MPNISIEEREKLIDAVEDVMLRGYDRPAQIARMVPHDPPLTFKTASSYADVVRERWRKASTTLEREEWRLRLIGEAREVIRRSYAVLAGAQNFEGNTFNAQVAALRNIVKAEERIAKLLGLDVTKIELQAGQEALDAATDALLSAQPETNAVRALRGLSEDSRQERLDDPVPTE